MLEFLLHNDAAIHGLSFLGGIFLTLLGNYLKFASDIAFIKGQLTEIIRKHDSIDAMSEKYDKLEKDFARTTLELNKALKQIKYIEFKVLSDKSGGLHG